MSASRQNLRYQQRLKARKTANHYIATISYFPGSNRLAEIFLGNGRAGSDIDAAAKDSAVVASIALQHGVPVETIRKALLRDAHGRASSPLGTVLDLLAEGESEP
jgi:hypothetical protein